MSRRGIEHFLQPLDWTEQKLKELGYRRYAVSIFDHWLTADEWNTNPYVSLERARAHGVEAGFHEQNRRFRQFYRIIFENGVYRLTGSRMMPQVVWYAGWDRRLKKAVTAMIEDRAWGSECYAPAFGTRFIADDARTDIVLLEDHADDVAISAIATCNGLTLIG